MSVYQCNLYHSVEFGCRVISTHRSDRPVYIALSHETVCTVTSRALRKALYRFFARSYNTCWWLHCKVANPICVIKFSRTSNQQLLHKVAKRQTDNAGWSITSLAEVMIWISVSGYCLVIVQIRNRVSKFLPRCIICNAVLAIVKPSVCRSVCPSIKCVICDKTKKLLRKLLYHMERSMHLVLRHEEWLVGDVPFYLKFWARLTHPLEKRRIPIEVRS